MPADRLPLPHVSLFEPRNYQRRFGLELPVGHVVVGQCAIERILAWNKRHRNITSSRRAIGIIKSAVICLPIEIPRAAKVWYRIIASSLLTDPEDRGYDVGFPRVTLDRRPRTCGHEHLRLDFKQRLLAQLHRVSGKVRRGGVRRARLLLSPKRSDGACKDYQSEKMSHAGKEWPVSIRFSHLRQGLSLWKNQRRWRLRCVKHYLFHPYIRLISVLRP